ASVAGNVLLAALCAYLLLDREPQSAAEATASTTQAGLPTPPSAPLATASVDDEKVLALARLEAAIPPVEASQFWQADADQEYMRRMLSLEAHRDRIRNELTARFGAGAADDPAFTRLFKPLNARFHYLSSKSQLGLLKLQQSRPAPARGSPILVRGNGQPFPDLAAAEQQREEYENNVRGILTPAEWQEYQLRESRAARQLRASGIAASEEEFRAVFAVLQQSDQETTAAGYVAAQERLNSMLGANRYARYSSARDPAYGALEAAGLRHQLTPQQISGVYAVMLAARDKLARLSMDPAAAQRTSPDAATQRVIDQRQKDVARLVGDAAATDLIDTYMKQTMSIDPRQNPML
ncbi:MAG TPA: hypothetical protein VFO82_05810, partial [Steroidobacteraceae bacterium]|nr:hypothetical protein [Steroidobacteraceae bacterium]